MISKPFHACIIVTAAHLGNTTKSWSSKLDRKEETLNF